MVLHGLSVKSRYSMLDDALSEESRGQRAVWVRRTICCAASLSSEHADRCVIAWPYISEKCEPHPEIVILIDEPIVGLTNVKQLGLRAEGRFQVGIVQQKKTG
jgi:hypothetical protein